MNAQKTLARILWEIDNDEYNFAAFLPDEKVKTGDIIFGKAQGIAQDLYFKIRETQFIVFLLEQEALECNTNPSPEILQCYREVIEKLEEILQAELHKQLHIQNQTKLKIAKDWNVVSSFTSNNINSN